MIKIHTQGRTLKVLIDFQELNLCNIAEVAAFVEKSVSKIGGDLVEAIQEIKSDSNFICPEEDTNYEDDTIEQ